MTPYPKRLIEVDLPIARISAHARREKSIRHGHISTLHIWWARRPLAACRAVILAALWPDPVDLAAWLEEAGGAEEIRAPRGEALKPSDSVVIRPRRFLDEARSRMARWATIGLGKTGPESYEGLVRVQKNPGALDDPAMLRAALLDFIADFADWDHSTDPDYLETARALTQAAHESLGGEPGTRPMVVDPFAGGGSIPLEALRVGADAFASDLNPIPVLLNKVVLEYIPKYGRRLADEVRKWGQWVKEQAEKELAPFYPKDPDGSTPIAYLWARTILSEAPDQGTIPIEVPLMRSMWLAKKAGRKRALRWVRDAKGNVRTQTVEVTYWIDGKPTPMRVRRPMLEIFEPRRDSEVESGTVARGHATCPVTGYTTKVDRVRAQLKRRRGGAADARLFCVVTTRQSEQGRFYRLPTKADEAAFEAARDELARRADAGGGAAGLSIVPDEPISLNELRRISVPIYGMERWGDLFSPRQALALATLAQLVRQAGDCLRRGERPDLGEKGGQEGAGTAEGAARQAARGDPHGSGTDPHGSRTLPHGSWSDPHGSNSAPHGSRAAHEPARATRAGVAAVRAGPPEAAEGHQDGGNGVFSGPAPDSADDRPDNGVDVPDPGLAQAVGVCLGLAVGRQADAISSFCRWASGGEFQAGTFARQALGMMWDFSEVCPFALAGGGWGGALEWVTNVLAKESDARSAAGRIEQASATAHPLSDDAAAALITDPPYYDAVPYAYLSDFFYVWLRRTLADAHPLLFREPGVPKDNEIVVDRPHQLSTSTKDIAFYEGELTRAFAEGRRVLAPSGVGTIVFASKTTASWEAILKAIIDAGFIITGSWPIDTEREARVAAQGQARLGSSVHIAVRPRETPSGALAEGQIGEWREVLGELAAKVADWMPRLSAEGVVGADAIFACLGPALEVFSRYSRVEKASGEEVTLREYLEHVWAAVAGEALSMIFRDADAAGLEPDARLTAMWLWTIGGGGSGKSQSNGNGNGEVEDDSDDEDESEGGGRKGKAARGGFLLEFDAARKIAQGLGVHLERSESIVEIKGETARLLPVSDRVRYLFGKDADGSAAATGARGRRRQPVQGKLFAELEAIESDSAEQGGGRLGGIGGGFKVGATVLDRVHQAMLLFAAGRGEALRRFLVDDGVGRDGRFWKLAQSLSALYPSGTDEKRWVDGVLARKKGLGF